MTAYSYSFIAEVQMKAVYVPATTDPSEYLNEARNAQMKGAVNWSYKDLPIGPVFALYEYWVSENSVSFLSDVKVSSVGFVEANSLSEAILNVESLKNSGDLHWEYRGIPIPSLALDAISGMWVTESVATPTSTLISVSSDPASVGVQTSITATITSSPEAIGNVEFVVNDILISILPLISGEATLNTTFTEFGNKTIRATYLGYELFLQSSDTYVLQVDP